MKNLIIISVVLLAYMQAQGQDTLITTKGQVIPCHIYTLYPDKVVYKDTTGNFKEILNADVEEKMIHSHPIILKGAIEKQEPFQLKINHIQLAGEELQNANSIFYGGMAGMLIGGVLTGAGVLFLRESEGAGKGMIYAGAGICTVGLVINLSAFSKINNAGEYLRNYKP